MYVHMVMCMGLCRESTWETGGNIREKIGVKWLKEKKRHIGIVF